MKVILQQDVQGTGNKGQLVNVADGYARNFLLPRKLAIVATPQAVNELKNREAAAQYRAKEDLEKAVATGKIIQGKTVRHTAKAGSGGRLFGAVTTREIAEDLKNQLGVTADRKKISLSQDIKSFGTYQAEIRLHPKVKVSFFVAVTEE